ncbi:hypothetical protein EDM76_05075 [bacterium]|nr:MAG: hypothetical protein EDM76_05075 [bacterium]
MRPGRMAPGLWAAVCAVLISACGGGGDEGAPAAVTGSPAAPSASGDPAAVVATIKGDATGVTATEIRIGSYYPKTGPSAIHDHIEKGWTLYFDEVNRKGGIAGRKMRFLVEDDAFNPSITVTMVKKLVEQDQVFMLFNGLGTPTSLATVGYLEQHGVPSLFIASGASRWATAGPAFIGLQPDFVAEGRALGEFMLRNFPGKKYGIIFQNDDMGKSGRDGIKAAVGTGLTLVGEETYEAGTADITSQALKLTNAGAEVIGAYAMATQLAGMLKNVRAQGKSVTFLASSISAQSTTARLAEGAMDGVYTAGYVPDPSEAASNPAVRKVVEFLREHGVEHPTTNHIYGWMAAEHLERLLTVTGPNLNRASLLFALENLAFQGDWQCSICYAPTIVTGNDRRPIETMFIQRWDEAKHAFVRVGDLIDIETTHR